MNSNMTVESPAILELLDEIGLDFALHTHHPMTHLEVDKATTAELGSRITASC